MLLIPLSITRTSPRPWSSSGSSRKTAALFFSSRNLDLMQFPKSAGSRHFEEHVRVQAGASQRAPVLSRTGFRPMGGYFGETEIFRRELELAFSEFNRDTGWGSVRAAGFNSVRQVASDEIGRRYVSGHFSACSWRSGRGTICTQTGEPTSAPFPVEANAPVSRFRLKMTRLSLS